YAARFQPRIAARQVGTAAVRRRHRRRPDPARGPGSGTAQEDEGYRSAMDGITVRAARGVRRAGAGASKGTERAARRRPDISRRRARSRGRRSGAAWTGESPGDRFAPRIRARRAGKVASVAAGSRASPDLNYAHPETWTEPLLERRYRTS